MRYLSPAIVFHTFASEIAGTSAARYRRYAAETRAFKASYVRWAGPYIVAGRRPSAAEAERLSGFAIEDEGVAAIVRRNLFGSMFLAIVAAALVWLTDRQLRRMIVGCHV